MIIYLNIDVVLFGSCSHMIMMMPKVDPRAEQKARIWNRDRLRNRMSLVKKWNEISSLKKHNIKISNVHWFWKSNLLASFSLSHSLSFENGRLDFARKSKNRFLKINMSKNAELTSILNFTFYLSIVSPEAGPD